jgi:hypothetical protein
MDAYCYDCAVARCDTTDSDCPRRTVALPDSGKVGKTFSLFAFNPAQDDSHRERRIDQADLAAAVLRLSDQYLAVLVEQDRD